MNTQDLFFKSIVVPDWKSSVVKTCACLASMAALWTLSLPLYADFVIALILIGLCLTVPAKEFGVLAISTCATIALFSPLTKLLDETGLITKPYPTDNAIRQTYRPTSHELVIFRPHGNLSAIDPLAPMELREPSTTIRARIDNLGYRNPFDYHGQLNVVVGDSFTIGAGLDEPDTLASQLASKFAIDAYQIAFPSEPIDYERRAAWFLSAINPHVNFSFIIYEGNDFHNSSQKLVFASPTLLLPPNIAKVLNNYDDFRRKALQPISSWLNYDRVFFSITRRLERALFERKSSHVSTYTIGPHLVAFYEPENLGSVDPHPQLTIDLNAEVIRRTACIFFAPTKLRVYADELPTAIRTRVIEPPPSYELLVRTYAPFGISIIDLTPQLKEVAKTALKEGRYVYGRDDTHWNRAGVAAIAPTVAECMRSRALSHSPGNMGIVGPQFVFDGRRLSIEGREITIGEFGVGAIDRTFEDNQNVLIEGWAATKDGQHAAKRVLAFAGTQLASSVPTRIPRPDVEAAIGSGGRTAGFQLAIPRNLVERGLESIRIFAVLDESRAAEFVLKKN